MSNIAPSPSSSSSDQEENDQSGNSTNSKSAPPSPGSTSSSSSRSPPNNSKGESSPPPSPKSGESRSTPPSDSQDSQDSSSSSSPPSPSSRSSPAPSSQPSPKSSPPSSFNGGGGNSKSSPPSPSDESSPNSGGNSENSKSPPPPGKSPPPQQRSGGSSPSPPSPSSSQAPPTETESSSSSSKALPSRSSPSPPQKSNNNDESTSSSEPSPRSPSSSSSPPPPPPTNQSGVVFIPVPVTSNGPPGALPPPGSTVTISPGSSVTTSANNLTPTSQSQVADAGSQVPGSSGSPNDDALSQSSSLASSSRVGSSHVAAAIAGATVTGLLFVVLAVFLVVWRRKKRRSTDGIVYGNDGSYYKHSGQLSESGMLYQQPPGASAGFSYGYPPGTDHNGGGYYPQSGMMESKSSFSYEELTSITSNFSRDNVIGEGGFGCVFKGWLADGKCVAVKQLRAGGGQGEREFQAEVEIISRVHHRHLVSLVGYCVAAHHRMLIYEFVPNGTLEHHLHGRGVPVMDWPTRLRIAIGAAKGLAYLHEDCHPRIIHRDIKSANILLDYSFEAQVADFGLAKLSNDTNTHVSTRIMGTFGYLAPEYASSGKLTDRSDVFSFGVVLLELITGRKPVDQTRPLGEESLVEWARPVLADAVETGDLDALVDPRLDGAYNRGEMTAMVEAAAACVRHSAPKRPRMVQVMRALDDDAGGMSDLTNGVKVGQSNRNHAAAIQQLRLTAFASEEFTGEFEQGGGDGGSTDSETQPINQRRLE